MKAGPTVALLGGLIAVGTMGLLLWRSHSEALGLRQENERLRARLAATEAAHISAPAHLGETTPAVSPELLRLRGEVAQLRRQTNELKALQSENAKLKAAVASAAQTAAAEAYAKSSLDNSAVQPLLVPRETWAFAGYGSPESTLQTAVWAMSNGDPNSFLAALSPPERARMEAHWKGKTEEQIGAESRREMEKLAGFRILDRQVVSDDEVVLRVFAEGEDSDIRRMRMKRFGSEWKFDGVSKDRRSEPRPR